MTKKDLLDKIDILQRESEGIEPQDLTALRLIVTLLDYINDKDITKSANEVVF